MTQAPREHIVHFLPFENALLAGESALPRDAKLRAARSRRQQRGTLGTPSVLSPVTADLNNRYEFRPERKTRASSHPLYFACVIGGVKWRFYQGADPLHAPAALTFVTRNLQPHVAIRLNEWPADASEDVGARAYSTYGARCQRILYVPDLLPIHILEADKSGTREHALALMLHELFELLIDLLSAMPPPTPQSTERQTTPHAQQRSSSSSSSSSSDSLENKGDESSSTSLEQKAPISVPPESGSGSPLKISRDATKKSKKLKRAYKRAVIQRLREPPERAVYIHCHAGKERSRFVTVALHGALYALASRIRKENPLKPMVALCAWADLQSCFGSNALSLRALLPPDSDDMFRILAVVVARLAGITDKKELEAARTMLEKVEQAVSIRGNYHNVCAAGADCPNRNNPMMSYLCYMCHATFFCGLDCVMRSAHVHKGAQCNSHFSVDHDVPLVLRASALEPTVVYHEKQRARARAGTGTITDLSVLPGSSSGSGSGSSNSNKA